MNWPGKLSSLWVVGLCSIFPAGCHILRPGEGPYLSPPGLAADNSRKLASLGEPSSIQTAAFFSAVKTAPDEKSPETASEPQPMASAHEMFSGMAELSVDALVQQVLERNPSLAQMVAAWQAASARYPQVTSLDDPILALTSGPATFGSTTVNPAYRIYIEQKYPYPGKLKLRGERALAEADAAGNDVEDIRLQLVEAAKNAFYEYYLVYRAVAVNNDSIRLLAMFRQNALTRVKTGQVPQQDIFQADVEIGRQHDRGLVLEQMRAVSIARINTLVNLPPDLPLPMPPSELEVEDGLPEAAELRAAALARRPDLRALASRIDADQAALALANKEFCPDFTPFAMIDRFMGNNAETEALAAQIGLSVNLPVRRQRRYAGVAEAKARLNQRQAELNKQINQVSFEVQQASAQVEQTKKAVRLYEKTVLPAAQSNIKAAMTEYVTGKINFLTLLEAERNLIGLRDRYYELLASYYSRQATLERAVGGPLSRGPVTRRPQLPPPRTLNRVPEILPNPRQQPR